MMGRNLLPISGFAHAAAVLLLPALLALLPACRQGATSATALHKKVVQGRAQGTYYAITYYDSRERDLKPAIDSLLVAFDRSASNYVDSSIISRVNANLPTALDTVFMGNFLLAQEVAERTNGDFDITVRPLVELWGFGKRDTINVTKAMVDSVMRFVGYHKVRLVGRKLVKDDPRLQLDFNAIAQGYSVDVMAGYLRSLGIQRFLIDIGGELYASGNKPDSSLWRVGIERPKDNEAYGEQLSAIVSLRNRGLATSGNYRKFYIKNGIKYSHTIDPHTGYPVRRSILSATVLADRAAVADAYATAFMVMGVEAARRFLAIHPELDALLIYSDSLGQYRFFETEGVKKIIEESR